MHTAVNSGRSGLATTELQEKRRSRWFLVGARAAVLVAALFMLAAVGRVAAIRAASAAVRADAGATDLVATLPPMPEPADAGVPTVPIAPMAPMAPLAPASSARATPEDPVYVNYASAEQLQRLPGVGAKRAEAIVALRGRLGRFQRVEDLLRVKGIGRTTIKKLRPLVRLGAPEAGAL